MWQQQWKDRVERVVNAAWFRPASDPSATEGNNAAEPAPAERTAEEAKDAEIMERLKELPPSVGVSLVTAGVVGAIVPGSLGTPLILAGGLILAPELFGKVDAAVQRRFPRLRHQGVQALGRFLQDLERRYPSTPAAGASETQGPAAENREAQS